MKASDHTFQKCTECTYYKTVNCIRQTLWLRKECEEGHQEWLDAQKKD